MFHVIIIITMNAKKIIPHALAFAVLLLPIVASAHCDATNSDGGCGVMTNPDGSHATGASALLSPTDPRWWYLLATSMLLIAILSRVVWKYLQVEEPKKPITAKPEEKKPIVSVTK